MSTDRKKKIIILSISLFFFLFAGIFQMIDEFFDRYVEALLSLAAHIIFITLVISWGASLIHRILRKDHLFYFIFIAILLLFMLVTRMIKYMLTTSELNILSRLMWYSYYVPQCFIPPTLFLLSLSIENKKGKPISRYWNFIYLPALILIILFYTNDYHMLAFNIKFESDGIKYTHGILYYLVIVWEILVTLISVGIMSFKCKISSSINKMWIPLITLFLCIGLTFACFFTKSKAFKVPELLSFTCIVFIEICISIGLIPSNNEYSNFFNLSTLKAFITDENFNVIYKQDGEMTLAKKEMKKATIGPIMLNENTILKSKKISGGYVFRFEDLSAINKINMNLKEIKEQILEENDLIEAENEVKNQKAKIEERKKLYLKMEECTKDELKRIYKILEVANKEEDTNNFIYEMRLASLLAAYIKRRNNLTIITEKNEFVDVQELEFSMKESLNYLSSIDVYNSLDFDIKGMIKGNIVCLIYDFFEIVISTSVETETSIIVHVFNKNNKIYCSIETDESDVHLRNIERILKQKISEGIKIYKEDEITYFVFEITGEISCNS